jgi:hypothetical protein
MTPKAVWPQRTGGIGKLAGVWVGEPRMHYM